MKGIFLNTIKVGLKTNKLSTILNIVGLSAGLACCIILMLYLQHELSYDNFNKDGEAICRVINVSSRNGQKYSSTPYILATTFKNSIPEISEFTRMQFMGNESSFIVSGEKEFNEDKIIGADSSFFKVFSFEYLRGEKPEKVLSSVDKILISESTSRKYFGNDDGIGKTLVYKAPYIGENDFTVAGIYKDFPANSHMQADFIFPLEWDFKNYGDWMLANWSSNAFCTYFKFIPNSSFAEIASKIPAVLETHAGEIDANREDLHKSLNYILQPLSEIHLYSTDIEDHDTVKKGSYSRLVIFGTIAVLILVVAIVNFILLSLSETRKKLKSIAIRKISGASNFNLIKQVNFEFFGVFIISLIVAFVLIAISLPYFERFVGERVMPESLSGYAFLLLFLLLSLVLGTIASGYVSIILAKAGTIKAVKDTLTPRTSSHYFRKGMVTFQITAFIVLLTSSLYINRQLNYINKKDLGFDKESLLKLRFANDLNSYTAFHQELMKNPLVINASGSTTSPISGGSWRGNLKIGEQNFDEDMEVLFTDAEFLETYKMDLVEGRFFSDEFSSDKTEAIVINETAARSLGLGNQTIGHSVDWNGFVSGRKKIVGIVRDFNMRSLYEKIEPLALLINTNQTVSDVSIRIQPGAVAEVVNSVRSLWNKMYTETPFVISFADLELEKAYKAETTTGAIIDAFTILAVFVSCLGFFGMSLMAAQQKTKEIGIRKVNGARISEVMVMLNKDFVKWVGMAFVIATPIAYYAMNKWLQNFAYRTGLSWWIFGLAGLLALGIGLLTVSWQSYRAASRNPVEALRYE